jgi:hypothetical protein
MVVINETCFIGVTNHDSQMTIPEREIRRCVKRYLARNFYRTLSRLTRHRSAISGATHNRKTSLGGLRATEHLVIE